MWIHAVEATHMCAGTVVSVVDSSQLCNVALRPSAVCLCHCMKWPNHHSVAASATTAHCLVGLCCCLFAAYRFLTCNFTPFSQHRLPLLLQVHAFTAHQLGLHAPVKERLQGVARSSDSWCMSSLEPVCASSRMPQASQCFHHLQAVAIQQGKVA